MPQVRNVVFHRDAISSFEFDRVDTWLECEIVDGDILRNDDAFLSIETWLNTTTHHERDVAFTLPCMVTSVSWENDVWKIVAKMTGTPEITPPYSRRSQVPDKFNWVEDGF